jgi:hypothetical protein
MNVAKLSKCLFCNESQLKLSIQDTNGIRQFINPDTKKLWKGKECPDCIEYFTIEEDPTLKLSLRKCKTCTKFLPTSRYFNCEECQPSVSIMDEFIYETEELDDHMIAMAEDLLED